MGELDDRPAVLVGEVLAESGVGESEVPGNGDAKLLSLWKKNREEARGRFRRCTLRLDRDQGGKIVDERARGQRTWKCGTGMSARAGRVAEDAGRIPTK